MSYYRCHKRTMTKYAKYQGLEREHSNTDIKKELTKPTVYETYKKAIEERKKNESH